MNTIYAYCRVSTGGQDLGRQRHEILEYANRQNWHVERFITAKMSATKSEEKRCVDQLKEAVKNGEAQIILFSELSRLGRSISEIVRLVDWFTSKDVELHFIKENLVLSNGPRDISTKVIYTMFSLLAEIERDLISERTKGALAAAKSKGVKLGRPAGSSKLDDYEQDIKKLVRMEVKQKTIANQFDCTESTLSNWLKRKRLEWAVTDEEE